jgi:hypothetical protein
VTLIDGEPAGSGLTSARELLTEIGALFSPTNDAGAVIRTQVIRANDPAALVLAERLLAVPLEGLDEESARKARLDRLAYVLDVCRAFADLCRREPSKVQFWRPGMLSLQVATGKTLSPWQMIEHDIAKADRAAGTAQVRAREEAEARAAVAPPPAPTSPEEAAAAVERDAAMQRKMAEFTASLGARMRYGDAPVRASGRPAETEDDHEDDHRKAEHQRGRRSEVQAERNEARTIEQRRQMNAAMTQAREAKGSALTTTEANKIRVAFGAKQETEART